MDGKILHQNLYQIYADFSDFTEDFTAARNIDGNTRNPLLRELTAAKLELSTATFTAQEALGKASKVFSWEPDKTEETYE